MCGVVGFWPREASTRDASIETVRKMADTLRHRGPDDAGEWWDERSGLTLAHRRLSIVDLSREGHQPMLSRSGRYVISYNGEVYNFGPLRRELELSANAPPTFRGHSDTEVILACIEAWGLERALDRFIGMFAFALWDRELGELSLVRDRLGIKPLYYAVTRKGLLFGSELDALAAHPSFERTLDAGALGAYLAMACVPAPRAIYAGARKLTPGSVLAWSAPEAGRSRETTYWSALDVADAGSKHAFPGSAEDAAGEVERLLFDSVKLRMIADVPLGAFLSGGIDSSAVVAAMQAQASRPVRTFSIGNESAYYDEGESARRVAAHLGTEHTSLVVTAEQALASVSELARIYDEPFADASQIPTLLVSRLAREHVTVALSGDGGDEVFGGYNRHVWAPRLWRLFRWAPVALRRGLSRGLERRSQQTWDRVFERWGRWLPAVRRPGQQVHKLASVLPAKSPAELYARLRRYWDPSVARSGSDATSALPSLPELDGPEHALMLADLVSYLPDDILTKVDRASMAVSLEARVPLLDHRLVEFAWRLPLAMKVRGTTGKWVLRQVLRRYVPKELVERPKMGFIVPIGEWLRGPLRAWAGDHLNRTRIEQDGIFESELIQARWKEHLRGARDWGHELWTIVMFQEWHAARRTPGGAHA